MTLKPGWGWPAALAGLLVAGAAFDLVFLAIASRDPSFAVERDYYRKALAWDGEMAQQAANAELGWRVTGALTAARARDGRGRLEVSVADAAGAPLAGALVSGDVFHSARAAQVHEVALREEAPGRYAAVVPASRPGWWEVRLRVSRAGAVFTRTLALEVASP
jgi:nitrogen fixation protein FixH